MGAKTLPIVNGRLYLELTVEIKVQVCMYAYCVCEEDIIVNRGLSIIIIKVRVYLTLLSNLPIFYQYTLHSM